MWTGLTDVVTVGCPRCRLRLTPKRGARATTEAVFLEASRITANYVDCAEGDDGFDHFLRIPLLVTHATSLGAGAQYQRSRVRPDASVAWTMPASGSILYLDDQSMVLLETDIIGRNEVLARLSGYSTETGDRSWTIRYPRRGAQANLETF